MDPDPQDPYLSRSSTDNAEAMILVRDADGSAKISTDAKIKSLLCYFAANLGLTMYNKIILIDYGRPFFLTALHCFGGVVGTYCLSGGFIDKPLTVRDNIKLGGFSILYTCNIAVSNLSLSMVSVPFHQTVRAITPAFLVAIYRFFYRNTYPLETYLSLVPVMIGVALVSYGDYNATLFGCQMTLLGAALAAVKTVTTNRMQTSGLHLSALELLYHMSPMALVLSSILAFLNGEFKEIDIAFNVLDSYKVLLVLLGNSALAFALNYSSFSANKRVGALSMAIAGNLKQILIVLFSIIHWHLKTGWINAIGICITLAGTLWYSLVELFAKPIEGTLPGGSR